jgi:hypothetical protein
MINCKKCGIEKNSTNAHKCNKSADGFQTYCKKCKNEVNLIINRACRKRYYEKHRERVIARNNEYTKRTLVRKRERDAAWAKAHPEVMKSSRKKFYEANRGRLMAALRRRQKIKDLAKNLSPAYQLEMEGFYLFCRIFKGFEVDHIIPMNGKKVSGLHVPSNLQILTQHANRSKRNYFMENDNGC